MHQILKPKNVIRILLSVPTDNSKLLIISRLWGHKQQREFLFRGILQQKFKVIFGNIHVAIWVTGFLFSAFHFQFYGLIPRMLLGVLFGYLFYWSNNLWLPILAHFINNAYMLTVLYFYRDEMPELTAENTSAPEWYLVVLSIILTIGLSILFRKLSLKKH